MSKIKEAEVRRQLLTILPQKFDWDGRGIKVRIYEIDQLVDYILNSYNAGVEEGKSKAQKHFMKIIRKI